MSLIPFWNFDSESGDKFEFRVTNDKEMYLFHLTNEGEFVNDRLLKGATDKEKIEDGLADIGDFLQNLSTVGPTIDLMLEELAKARKKMNK